MFLQTVRRLGSVQRSRTMCRRVELSCLEVRARILDVADAVV